MKAPSARICFSLAALLSVLSLVARLDSYEELYGAALMNFLLIGSLWAAGMWLVLARFRKTALFADFKVRFVPQNASPAEVRALLTVGDLRDTAGERPAPTLETAQIGRQSQPKDSSFRSPGLGR
jgi:hypothetical protein